MGVNGSMCIARALSEDGVVESWIGLEESKLVGKKVQTCSAGMHLPDAMHNFFFILNNGEAAEMGVEAAW